MPIDPSQIQWDGPAPSAVQWDAPKPIGPPQPLSFAEKYVAPALEATIGSNPQGSMFGRFIQGAADYPIGAYQAISNALGVGAPVNQRIHDLERQYEEQRAIAGSKGLDVARLGGNLASAALVPSVEAAPSLLGKLAQGAGIGAAFSAAQPVADESQSYGEQKAKQIGSGAAFGVGGTALGSALAGIVRPNTSDAAKALMQEGVTLTPGQVLGGGFQRAEDAMTSVPIIGDFIRDAKNRTLTDFNRAAYARALRPIGKDAAEVPVGPEGVLTVKNALGDAYSNLLPKLNWKGDAQFSGDLNTIEQMAATLPDKEASKFRQVLETNLGRATPTGRMDGETFKQVESSLSQEAKKFSGSPDPYQKDLGNAFQQTLNIFRGALARSNPQYADELQGINQGYANFARIRGAAASAGDKSSGFTPSQLAAAVRNMDKSAGKGATATGTALMQDLSDAGRAVLPSTVADSGTPLRHAVQVGAGALLGHEVLPEWAMKAAIPVGAGGALMTLPYTSYGQKLAMALLARRPEGAATVADAIRSTAPLLGAASAPALTQ